MAFTGKRISPQIMVIPNAMQTTLFKNNFMKNTSLSTEPRVKKSIKKANKIFIH